MRHRRKTGLEASLSGFGWLLEKREMFISDLERLNAAKFVKCNQSGLQKVTGTNSIFIGPIEVVTL